MKSSSRDGIQTVEIELAEKILDCEGNTQDSIPPRHTSISSFRKDSQYTFTRDVSFGNMDYRQQNQRTSRQTIQKMVRLHVSNLREFSESDFRANLVMEMHPEIDVSVSVPLHLCREIYEIVRSGTITRYHIHSNGVRLLFSSSTFLFLMAQLQNVTNALRCKQNFLPGEHLLPLNNQIWPFQQVYTTRRMWYVQDFIYGIQIIVPQSVDSAKKDL